MAKRQFATKVFEPIEAEINGKSYRVRPNLTYQEFQRQTQDPDNASNAAGQLAYFFDCAEEEFQSLDIRLISEISQYVVDEITKQMQGKSGNPSKVVEKR